MKNKLKTLISLLVLGGMIFNTYKVSAVEVDANDQIQKGDYTSYYVRMDKNGFSRWEHSSWLLRASDGAHVYCVQPFVLLADDDYKVTKDDVNTVMDMTNEQWERVKMIAYYGYGYDGHDSEKWYMAAQMLIWRTVDPEADIYFTESFNGDRNDDINASTMNKIEKLVAKHSERPEFLLPDSITLGDVITATDLNKVLENFKITNAKNAEITKNENHLTIKATNAGGISFDLERKYERYNDQPILYYAEKSQNVMRVGNLKTISQKYQIDKVNVAAKLKVIKIDAETGEVIRRSGIKFKIYDVANNKYICQGMSSQGGEVCEYKTDENGEFTTSEPLKSGTYRLEEVDQKIDGYTWNQESQEFSIDENSQLNTDSEGGILFEAKFENYRVKGKVVIQKVGEVLRGGGQVQFTDEPLSDIKFGLYSQDGTLMAEGWTDDEGFLTFDDLDLGVYYVKELETHQDYILDNSKHFVILGYKDQYTAVVEYNTLIENKLKSEVISSYIENNITKNIGSVTTSSTKNSGKSSFAGSKNNRDNDSLSAPDTGAKMMGDGSSAGALVAGTLLISVMTYMGFTSVKNKRSCYNK